MNFYKVNNNIELNKMTLEKIYPNRLTVDKKYAQDVPLTAYGNYQKPGAQYNYNFEDMYVEKYYEDDKDDKKGASKISSNARVVLEKLPDSVLKQYLLKKEKKQETRSYKRRSSDSSVQQMSRRENCKINNHTKSSLLKCISKKKNLENDKFVKELFNPTMQQYLANTEMGCLTDDFMESIPESKEYPENVNNNTINSLIENLSSTDETKYPVPMEEDSRKCNFVENFDVPILPKYSDDTEKNNKADGLLISVSDPLAQPCNLDLSRSNMQSPVVDVEKIDVISASPADKDTSSKKKIKKMKRGTGGRPLRKNITTNQCQRICPNCFTYVQKAYNATAKVKCDTCDTLTFYQCNKCKKLCQTHSGMSYHLLHQCEARTEYKCVHCKYVVRKKHALGLHISRTHEKQILQYLIRKRKKIFQDIKNKSNLDSEQSKQYDNLIVLRKQKDVKCQSEWVIENTKRRDPKVEKVVDSPNISTLSTPPSQSSTTTEGTSQLHCQHCDKEVPMNPTTLAEMYCRMCGTVLLFKCSKCNKTCDSYHNMKHHLKRVCAFKENIRQSFHCVECNYRSHFKGLVINHQNRVHSFYDAQEFSSDNMMIQNDENLYVIDEGDEEVMNLV